jgi:ABC-2 type transport system ATP-binding protein
MTPTISATALGRRYRDQVALVASWFYPNWDEDLAQQLLKDFELPPRRRIKRLSRGMRSAVGIVIGLAARAELTLFDEP